MDRLSRCYESDFCINAETGETIRGRYYWADPGATPIEGPHNFGSAVWLDPEDRGGFDYLGDQFTNVTEDDGRRPRVRPFTRRFDFRRQAGCNPEPSRVFRMTTDTFAGLPRYCYRTDLLECLLYDTQTDPHARQTWCFVAKVCEKLYDAAADLEAFVRAYIPDVVAVDINTDGAGPLPQWIFWRTPCGRGAIFAGTTNFQQAALQAFYGVNGPTAVGRYYTNLFWHVNAEVMRGAFEAFAGAHVRRTFLGGHSYGGAVAALVAAAESTVENVDEYRLVTLGAPRFGNGQLYGHLSGESSVFLQNEGDPVPSLPPSYPTLTDMLPIIGPLAFFFWQRWAPPPVQTVIRPDGTTYQSNDWNGGDVAANAIAGIIRDRGVIPTFLAHKIKEYRRRICPPPSRPRGTIVHLVFTSNGHPFDIGWDLSLPFNFDTKKYYNSDTSGNSLAVFSDTDPTTPLSIITVSFSWADDFGNNGIFEWTFTYAEIAAGVVTSDLPTIHPAGSVVVLDSLESLTLSPMDFEITK